MAFKHSLPLYASAFHWHNCHFVVTVSINTVLYNGLFYFIMYMLGGRPPYYVVILHSKPVARVEQQHCKFSPV